MSTFLPTGYAGYRRAPSGGIFSFLFIKEFYLKCDGIGVM